MNWRNRRSATLPHIRPNSNPSALARRMRTGNAATVAPIRRTPASTGGTPSCISSTSPAAHGSSRRTIARAVVGIPSTARRFQSTKDFPHPAAASRTARVATPIGGRNNTGRTTPARTTASSARSI